MSKTSNTSERTHLFVSYAVEDQALARWLTLKLTAEGYKVWCDQFKLLGGESYPRDIDEALKEKTFRVLALLSHASLRKRNPVKERTLALSLARERNEDFLIPLNVDGLKATDLDWMTSDLTYIPFNQSWANGLIHLLKKLETIQAPRTLAEGRSVAASLFEGSGVHAKPELLYANYLRIDSIPETISIFDVDQRIRRTEIASGGHLARAYWLSPTTFVTFARSISEQTSAGVRFVKRGEWCWEHTTQIGGVDSKHLASAIIRKSVAAHLLQRGLKPTERGLFFFPDSLLSENRLTFTDYKGERSWMRIVGERKFWRSPDQQDVSVYHVAFSLRLNRGFFGLGVFELRIGLHLTDRGGVPLHPRLANSRRKKICQNWWNDKWLRRYLAIAEFLGQGEDSWSTGDPGIHVRSQLLTVTSPCGINEAGIRTEASKDDDAETLLVEEDDIETE